jgi:hypothetical protein
LLVRLTAPPVEGAANAALLRFLARTLGVPASTLMLTHGTKGREKTILVTSLSPAQIANALASFL